MISSDRNAAAIETMATTHSGEYGSQFTRQEVSYTKLAANQELIGVHGFFHFNDCISSIGLIVKENNDE